LLVHFFRSNDEHAPPVVAVLVAADELARATGWAHETKDETALRIAKLGPRAEGEGTHDQPNRI
jgi:hypothetical protein